MVGGREPPSRDLELTLDLDFLFLLLLLQLAEDSKSERQERFDRLPPDRQQSDTDLEPDRNSPFLLDSDTFFFFFFPESW